MNGTELKRFRLGLGYESAQQLAEASGYKAQTLLAMECGSRNESVSLSNVKHCLDWTLDENIMTVANLFVEGNKMIDDDSKSGDYDMKIKIFPKSNRRVER